MVKDNPTEKDEILINKLKDFLGVKTETTNDVVTMLKDLKSRNNNNDLVTECLRVCARGRAAVFDAHAVRCFLRRFDVEETQRAMV